MTFQLKKNIVYDFSSYEDRIDWDAIALQSPFAVFMRASAQGMGTRIRWEDTTAVPYMAEAKKRSQRTGLYHLLTPNGIAEQAALYLNVWNKCGGADIACADVEVDLNASYPNGKGGSIIGNAVWQGHIKTFLDLIAAGTGKTPIIYTSARYWVFACTRNLLGQMIAPIWASSYPLWVAQYPDNPDAWTKPDAIPVGWKDYAMWQYSEKGRSNGFLANDISTANDWYVSEFGTVITPPPPPPPPVTGGYTATLTNPDGTKIEFVQKV